MESDKALQDAQVNQHELSGLINGVTYGASIGNAIVSDLESSRGLKALRQLIGLSGESRRWADWECLTRGIGLCLTQLGPMYIDSIDEVISLWLRRHGVWEPAESAFLAPALHGRKLVNFGCNIGWYVRLASLNGSRGVVAFDANPRAVAIARLNQALLDEYVECPVDISEGVVWDRQTGFRLESSESNFGASRVVESAERCTSPLDVTDVLVSDQFEVIISDIEGQDHVVLGAWLEQKREGLVMIEIAPGCDQVIGRLLDAQPPTGLVVGLLHEQGIELVDGLSASSLPRTLVLGRGQPYESHIRNWIGSHPAKEPILVDYPPLPASELTRFWVRMMTEFT